MLSLSSVQHVSSDTLRAMFASALSEMYQKEVPQYATLLEIVSRINEKERPLHHDDDHRVQIERHGAIRVGRPSELFMVRRLFAVLGMFPVSYYDLTVAGLPVHATGFRPFDRRALRANPFRVFVSLLRHDLIADEAVREKAIDLLNEREIFTPRCRALIEQIESLGGLSISLAEEFVNEALETFRWHRSAKVTSEIYKAMEMDHPLIADIVCFRGPHVNHLTPRVHDIDAAQEAMRRCGMQIKSTIEGPPKRKWAILLRQTSFLGDRRSHCLLG